MGSIYEKIPCLTCWNKNVWSLWTKNAFGHKFICKNSVFIAPYINYIIKKDPVDRLLTGLTAQQKGTTARWYSNKTSLYS